MNDNSNLNAALAAATCALLGSAAPASAADTERWSIDSGLLYYGESDGRVQDVSAALSAQRDFDDDRKLGLSLTADTLTGASASGAVALDRPQRLPARLERPSTALRQEKRRSTIRSRTRASR